MENSVFEVIGKKLVPGGNNACFSGFFVYGFLRVDHAAPIREREAYVDYCRKLLALFVSSVFTLVRIEKKFNRT